MKYSPAIIETLRVRESWFGAAPPVGMRVEQARRVQALPVEAHAVAVHHLRDQPFEGDRRPDRQAVEVHRDRDLLDDRAEAAQPFGRLAHLLHHVGLARVVAEAFGQHADAQARGAAAERRRCNLSTRTLYWRGSSPSGPAITSSSSALSATLPVIGPRWSIVASIGIAPV
jgi:hypothetical protein